MAPPFLPTLLVSTVLLVVFQLQQQRQLVVVKVGMPRPATSEPAKFEPAEIRCLLVMLQ